MTKTSEVSCIGCRATARGELSTLKIGPHDTNWLRPPKGWWVTPMGTPEGVTILAACDVCMKIGRWTPPESILKPEEAAEAVATPDEAE